MFEPDADEGCPACSFWIDNVGHLSHLHARDTSFAAVSRAPIDKLERYKQRMGWTIPWYSSYGSDFNYDFHVTLDPAVAPVQYNFKDQAQLEQRIPAGGDGRASRRAQRVPAPRGPRLPHLLLLPARHRPAQRHLQLARLTALGRQEEWEQPAGRGKDPAMSWVHRHDEYEPEVIGWPPSPQ